MDAVYYISLLLLILVLFVLPVLLLFFLIKPHILNNQSFIKKPFSRPKIFLVGLLIFFLGTVSFSGTMAATEPASVKQERIVREQAEEKARQDAEAKKAKEQEDARRREEEAKKPVVKQETKKEVIAFETSEQDDGSVAKGEKRTATEGVDGERTITYEVTYKEGVEVSRKEIKTEVTKEPVTKIVKNGTYVAPSTPPVVQSVPSSGSSSAYYKNCSAARAADAAPVYAGQPGYGRHLDRDGDGVGCE